VTDKNEKESLITHIQSSGKDIIDISYDEVDNFCGNIINLENQAG